MTRELLLQNPFLCACNTREGSVAFACRHQPCRVWWRSGRAARGLLGTPGCRWCSLTWQCAWQRHTRCKVSVQEDTTVRLAGGALRSYVNLQMRCVYLIGLRIAGRLGIFCLLDIFHHFPDEGMAVILILGHDNFKNKPQSPEKEGEFDIRVQNPDFLLLFCSISHLHTYFSILWIPQMHFMSNGNNKISTLCGGK